jgi:hypothetical protein
MHERCCSLFLNFLSNDLEPQLPYSCMYESLIYGNYEPTYSFTHRDSFASSSYKAAAMRFELCLNILSQVQPLSYDDEYCMS